MKIIEKMTRKSKKVDQVVIIMVILMSMTVQILKVMYHWSTVLVFILYFYHLVNIILLSTFY